MIWFTKTLFSKITKQLFNFLIDSLAISQSMRVSEIFNNMVDMAGRSLQVRIGMNEEIFLLLKGTTQGLWI